jgi:hypothetical protein
VSAPTDGFAVGDEVRLLHSPPLGGIVSSLDEDGATVCMLIGLSYQLRGPFPLSDLEKVTDA